MIPANRGAALGVGPNVDEGCLEASDAIIFRPVSSHAP